MSQDYLLANQPSELERLQLQSLVWEPSGRQLLSKSATDLADMPWTSAAEPWAGFGSSASGSAPPAGSSALTSTRRCSTPPSFLDAEQISNVELVVDDLFDSKLAPHSFDLVHARYQIAPLGRGREQWPRTGGW